MIILALVKVRFAVRRIIISHDSYSEIDISNFQAFSKLKNEIHTDDYQLNVICPIFI